MKSSKGKIGEKIPVTYFLVDPSHHVKVVSKQTFSIVDYGKAHQCGCTKADALIIKKYWVYMINKNRNKNLE